jgi:hypothetical protein
MSMMLVQRSQLNSIQDDAKLREVVAKHGPHNWGHIALLLPNRTAKQCRERWHINLNPVRQMPLLPRVGFGQSSGTFKLTT